MTIFFHQLKNFIQNDPLSDWFNLVNKRKNCYVPDIKSTFEIEIDEKKLNYKEDFFKFLRGLNQYYCDIHLESDQMHDLIHSKKVGIFINCYLHNKKYDILVKPDLIIHRDIFKEIFNQVTYELPEYIIIDILYKIIHFTADKNDILNQNNIFIINVKC